MKNLDSVWGYVNAGVARVELSVWRVRIGPVDRSSHRHVLGQLVAGRYMDMAKLPGYDSGTASPSQLIDIRLTADGIELCDGAAKCGREVERPWIGVHFECCGIYSRIYRDSRADRYESRCPRCAAPIIIRVSPEGVSTNIVRARIV